MLFQYNLSSVELQLKRIRKAWKRLAKLLRDSKVRLIWERFDWTKTEKPESPNVKVSKKNKNTRRFSKKDDLFITMDRFDNTSMQILGNGQFGVVYRVKLTIGKISKSRFQIRSFDWSTTWVANLNRHQFENCYQAVAVKKHLTPSLEALEDEQNSLFDFLEEAYMLSKLDSYFVNCLIGIGF